MSRQNFLYKFTLHREYALTYVYYRGTNTAGFYVNGQLLTSEGEVEYSRMSPNSVCYGIQGALYTNAESGRNALDISIQNVLYEEVVSEEDFSGYTLSQIKNFPECKL